MVNDRLLFANLSYEYFLTKKIFYSPYKPGNKIDHHFQLKNALPKDFSQKFNDNSVLGWSGAIPNDDPKDHIN